MLDRKPTKLEIDAAPAPLTFLTTDKGTYSVALPRGQHLVTIQTE
jgi:hypothetical protein